MRKITSILMLLAMCVGASWAQTTEEIQTSTSAVNPEHVYGMKNGNLRWMTNTTGPTVTLSNIALFAFFEGTRTGTGSETPYKIYCVTAQKWLSYAKAESYANGKNFATLVDTEAEAESWAATIQDGKDDIGNVYQFAPYNTSGAASKYMNWNGGPDFNPNDNTTIRVGLWQDNATKDNGSCWVVVGADTESFMNEVKEEYGTWESSVSANVGTGFGKYVKDETAYSAAKAKLDDATTIQDLLKAVNECKVAYQPYALGKYYRIKSTLRGTYMGLDGYTLNMKNKAEDDTDPTLIWKFEQENGKFYLRNVYAGLYPQSVPSGGDKTTTIGTSKDYAFTYAQHAAATETDPIQWNIFFGGTQVNVETNGNVNYWFQDAAHHYICEVESTENDLDKLCTDWYQNNVHTYTCSAEPIDLVEGATVISPTEYDAPSVVNAAIASLKEKEATLSLSSEGVTVNGIHQLYEALVTEKNNMAIVTKFEEAKQHGEPLSVTYTTTDAEFGTIILPVNWSKPEGWTRFSCTSVNAGVLDLTEVADGVNKNIPYIVQFSEAARNKKYQFIGYSTGAATDNRTQGLLTGVLAKDTKVPAGSYILANRDGKIGFYRVAEGADFTAAVNKCYLTLPASESRFEALFFDGTTTAIEGVQDAQAKQDGAIYNMAGQRLSKLQKGLNIVNGKVVLVK